MKFQSGAFVVLATSGTALGSWVDWLPFKDVTVTQTLTRTTAICPCNGEVRVTPAHAATETVKEESIQRYTVTGAIDPAYKQPAVITKAGPIVVVYTTAGSLTTKTGVKIELKPSQGPVVTKTIFTGPQPSDGLGWVDWNGEEDKNGGTLTRSHTQTVTVHGPAPTGPETEPWADWVATTNSKKTTTRSTTKSATRSTSKSSPWSASTSASSSVGPIGGSTTSSSYSFGHSTSSWSSTSSSSSSFSVGPIDGTTTSSTSTYSTTTSSSSFSVNPIDQTTTSSTSSFSFNPIDQTTTTSSSLMTTTSTSSFSVNPIDQSTSSSSSAAAVTSSSSSSADAVTSSSSSSADAVTSSSSSSAAAVTSSSSSSDAAITSSSSSSAAAVSSSTTVAASTTTSAASQPSVVFNDVRGLDYQTAILQQHNVHRANHSAADLVWNANLAAIAGQTAATCIYAHDVTTGGGGYGQNIGAGYTPNQVGQMITNDMYNGEIGFFPGPYDTDNIDLTNFGRFGHFTQIVWKGTTSVGCATQFCPNGLVNAGFTQYFTVCNYSPPGNFRGQYSNVGAPLGNPTVIVIANAN